jgi:hypothetical protein
MASSKKDTAAAQFSKVQRAQDGKNATTEYEAEARALRAKTERLRELRLARDAALPPAKPAVVKKKAAKQAKTPAEKLADWLDVQDNSGRNK